ncbi:MAG: hypothetical protein C0404_10375 [Verrucomicrobia bacterium]|nr:hypothetical protein [Verrucomicrobiota bacterium]
MLTIAATLIVSIVAATCSEQGADTNAIPKHIRYKRSSAEVNAEAKKRIERAFSTNTSEEACLELFDDVLICLPLLWDSLHKKHPDIKGDATDTALMPITDERGNRVDEMMVPMGSFSTEETKNRFIKAFLGIYQRARVVQVRKPTAAELSTYWSNCAWEISEPLYVVDFGKERVLLEMPADSFTVFAMERVDNEAAKELNDALAKARENAKKKEDEENVKHMADLEKQFGSRAAAVDQVLRTSFELLNGGELSMAEKGFMLVTKMDSTNSSAYWGLGEVVEFMVMERQRPVRQIEEAVRLKEKAAEYDKTNPRLLADLAKAYAYSAKLMNDKGADLRKERLEKALAVCRKAEELDPKCGPLYARWSAVLIIMENYKDAWVKVKRAQELGEKLPPAFLAELSRKMPDPDKKR